MTNSIDQIASTVVEGFKARMEKALERTRELRDAQEPEGKHSKKARDLRRILDIEDFGGHERAVEKLVETLAGEKLPSRRKDEVDPDTVKGAVVVPTDNMYSHNYTLGVPVLCDPDTDGDLHSLPRVDHSGDRGNWIHGDIKHGNFRFATDAEVAAYFKALATGEWEPPAEDDAAEAAR